MPDFVLRVEGEYSVVIEAACIEEVETLARASDEWSEPRRASITEIGEEDKAQRDLVVGV